MFGDFIKKHKDLNIVEKMVLCFLLTSLLLFFVQSFFRMSEIQTVKQEIKNSENITSLADGRVVKTYFDYLLGITKSKGSNTATFHIVGANRKFPLTVHYEANGDNVKITKYEMLGKTFNPSNYNPQAITKETFGYSKRILVSLILISVSTFIVIALKNHEKWEKYIQKVRCSFVYFKFKSIFSRSKLTMNIITLVYTIIMLYFIAVFINLCFYFFAI